MSRYTPASMFEFAISDLLSTNSARLELAPPQPLALARALAAVAHEAGAAVGTVGRVVGAAEVAPAGGTQALDACPAPLRLGSCGAPGLVVCTLGCVHPITPRPRLALALLPLPPRRLRLRHHRGGARRRHVRVGDAGGVPAVQV